MRREDRTATGFGPEGELENSEHLATGLLPSEPRVDALQVAMVLLSALLHAAWSIAIKGSADALAFNVAQSCVASAVALLLLLLVDLGEVPAGLWPILAGTGVAHALYLYWLSRAFALGDISVVYPIARATPALMPFAAVPLLGETISLAGGAGIATVVAGMWLLNVDREATGRSFVASGMIFAYLTLLTTVAYGLLDKSAMVHLDTATWTSAVPRPIFFFFMLYLASSVLFIPLALRRVPLRSLSGFTRREWRDVLVALGVSVASYGLILEALRTAQASYVVAVRQSSIFFVLLLSVLRLGERPSGLRVVGACLTVGGVSLIAFAN